MTANDLQLRAQLQRTDFTLDVDMTLPGHGITALPGVLVARYLGDNSEAARRWLARLWQILRPACCGRPAVPPRIWNT